MDNRALPKVKAKSPRWRYGLLLAMVAAAGGVVLGVTQPWSPRFMDRDAVITYFSTRCLQTVSTDKQPDGTWLVFCSGRHLRVSDRGRSLPLGNAPNLATAEQARSEFIKRRLCTDADFMLERVNYGVWLATNCGANAGFQRLSDRGVYIQADDLI